MACGLVVQQHIQRAGGHPTWRNRGRRRALLHLLMPSRFEPCGLNQLYAMRYGTVPVVHAVGGLRETVKPYNPHTKEGTGWQFDEAKTNKFQEAMGWALDTYREDRDSFQKIQLSGMTQDLSWGLAAERYEEKLIEAKYSW